MISHQIWKHNRFGESNSWWNPSKGKLKEINEQLLLGNMNCIGDSVKILAHLKDVYYACFLLVSNKKPVATKTEFKQLLPKDNGILDFSLFMKVSQSPP